MTTDPKTTRGTVISMDQYVEFLERRIRRMRPYEETVDMTGYRAPDLARGISGSLEGITTRTDAIVHTYPFESPGGIFLVDALTNLGFVKNARANFTEAEPYDEFRLIFHKEMGERYTIVNDIPSAGNAALIRSGGDAEQLTDRIYVSPEHRSLVFKLRELSEEYQSKLDRRSNA